MRHYIIIHKDRIVDGIAGENNEPSDLNETQKVIKITDTNKNLFPGYIRYTQDEINSLIVSGAAAVERLDDEPKNVVVGAPAPFANKQLPDGKKLYSRVTGNKYVCTTGINVLEYTITHNQVKFNELELIGGEIGDTVCLKVLDTVTGSYTTVPNYQLNQFGFNVNVGKDFYSRSSNYDADLFIGMRIVVEYDSISSKEVGINFVIHEVKS